MANELLTAENYKDLRPTNDRKRAWSHFDFKLEGVNYKEVEKFMRLHNKLGNTNTSQTFRYLLYMYEQQRIDSRIEK